MRKTTRIIAAVAAASALAFTAAACAPSGSKDGTPTVTWSTWGTPNELKAFEQFNAEFMERHPDIKVVFQPVASYGDYHSKLNTQLTSGNAPDVFYVGDDRIASVAANKVLEPLDSYLGQADSSLNLADFSQDLYRVATLDGSIYGLPNDVNPDALWFDREVLAAAGITEDPVELANPGRNRGLKRSGCLIPRNQRQV